MIYDADRPRLRRAEIAQRVLYAQPDPADTLDAVLELLDACELRRGDQVQVTVRRGAILTRWQRRQGSGGDPGEYEARADRLFGGERARWREESK